MKQWIFVALISALCIPATAFAHDHVTYSGHSNVQSSEFCVPVRGKITTAFGAPDSCDSPFGLCTTGTSTGWLLGGTTSYSAQGLAGQPLGEASILTPTTAEPDTTWAFGGDFIIDTPYGDVVARDVGVFDTAMGYLSEFARFQTGTGVFASAQSGVLFIYGEATPDGAGFNAKYRGRICWASYSEFYHAW